MKISALMTQPVLRIDEDSTAQQAAEMMGREHVGSLIVTRRGEDVGIITERDIISKIIAIQGDLKETRVKGVMSEPLITVSKNTIGEDTVRTMVENDVRRLPVTDNGRIIGIFTTSDLTKLATMNQDA
jgi:CBS domain-containing protein